MWIARRRFALIGLTGCALLSCWPAPTAAQPSSAAPGITEFSSGISAPSFPVGLAAGPDGNLWFTEYGGNRIGKITPSGTVTEYSAGITAGSLPLDIAAGPDGNLWFTEYGGDRIGRITPSGRVTEFSTGATTGSLPFDIAAGQDGNVWFTETDARIGRITPSGTVTEFSTGITPNSGPEGITAGPDGNLWFAETYGNQIGRISPSGTVTEYASGISANSRPTGITAGPDGNLWFTQPDSNQIGRISPSGTVTEYSSGISAISAPDQITAGPDGNIWFSEYVGGRIGRVNLRRAVTRLAGVDRIGTAIALSQSGYPTSGSASAVVLARADAFPDALTGAALAAAKQAPLLLTAPDSLDPRTAVEIRRALGPNPKTVYVLGGTAAVSAAVVSSIGGLGYPVVRLAGTDRYDTAAIVASAPHGLDNPSTIMLATGTNFPDGLCAGSAAGSVGGAVLLTANAALPAPTSSYLSTHPQATVYAIGGQAAAADPAATAVAGSDRYQTCAAVAARFFPAPTSVGIATGLDFPDGLAGGASAFAQGGPLLLSDPGGLGPSAVAYVSAHLSTITNIYIDGGTSVLPETISTEALSATSP